MTMFFKGLDDKYHEVLRVLRNTYFGEITVAKCKQAMWRAERGDVPENGARCVKCGEDA